jgi:hypothetical protein
MNIFQIQSKIKELSDKRNVARDAIYCIINSHMCVFSAFSSPSDKVDITSIVKDPRVSQAMETVAREMAEKVSNEIKDFEAKFVSN